MPSEITIETGVTGSEPRIRINIERGQRGSYGWSITVRGDEADEVCEEIDEIDRYLRQTYLKGDTID